MKTLKYLALFAFSATLLWSCSDDDDGTPPPVNEEEVITTVIVSMTDGTDVIVMTYRDLDGDGPDDPIVTVVGEAKAGTAYTGTVRFLNETEDPPEEVTVEIEEEDDEHQVFFLPNQFLDMNFDYENFDGDGNPLGTAFSATAVTTGSGNLRIVLRHEPTKPNDGTLADAGGETDIDVVFPVDIVD